MKSAFCPPSFNQEINEDDIFSQYKQLIDLLQQPAKSLKEAEFVYSQIENHAYIKKFFGENIQDKTAALQLCKNMSIEFFKRGDIVMAQGDQSDNKLYIILDGRVGVVINFKGPTPPEDAIYDIEMEEKLEKERLEKQQKEEDKNEIQVRENLVQILIKDNEEIQKKYIPFGEDPAMLKRTDINSQLKDQIENRCSVLVPKKKQIKDNSSNRPSFSQLIEVIKQRKSQRKSVNDAIQRKDSQDIEGYIRNKNNTISNTETPRNRRKETENQERRYQKQIESFGTKVNEIGQGTGFGDKALLAPTPKLAVRNATIIATTPLLCIIVYRKDFLRVVENFSKEAIFKEKTITREFKFFKDVSSTSLKERLLYYFQDINIRKNEYLCKEGEVGEGFYILAEGKVNIKKKIEDTNNIYYQKYQNVNICEIERPTFFCEELIFSKDKQPKFKYTIQIVSQKAHLFYCSRSNFINKFPKEAVEELQQFYLARDVSYSKLYEHSKEVQIFHDQMKKQNEKQINENVHIMNYQENKDLFTQMKNSSIDYQVKKAVPQLIDQLEFSQNSIMKSPKIKLDQDYDPAIIDFCSKVDVVMKKNQEEREMIKKIIIQKKIRTDKRTFKAKKSAYSIIFFLVENKNYKRQASADCGGEQLDIQNSCDQINEYEEEQGKNGKLGVDSEEKIKLLRQCFAKGNKINFDEIDLSLFYSNQDEIYKDPDINLLLDIKKPKNQITNKLPNVKQQEVNDKSPNSYDTKIANNFQNSEKDQSTYDKSPHRRSSDPSRLNYSNFETDELKTPPPEQDSKQMRSKLNEDELDLGYLDEFKKYSYFYMVKKGAIKIPFNTEQPQINLKRQILKKLNKRKEKSLEGKEKHLSNSFSIINSHQGTFRDRNLSSIQSYQEQDDLIDESHDSDTSQQQNIENHQTARSSKIHHFSEQLSSNLENYNKKGQANESKSPRHLNDFKQKKYSLTIQKSQIQQLNNEQTQQIQGSNIPKKSPLLSPIGINENLNLNFQDQINRKNKLSLQVEKISVNTPKSYDSVHSMEKLSKISQQQQTLGTLYSPKSQMSSNIQPSIALLANEAQKSQQQFNLTTKSNYKKKQFQRESLTVRPDGKILQFGKINSPQQIEEDRKATINLLMYNDKNNNQKRELRKEVQNFLCKTEGDEDYNDKRTSKKGSINGFIGDPNNFQITSLSNKCKQVQQTLQSESNQQIKLQSRGSKFINNSQSQPQSTKLMSQQQSAPILKKIEQSDNIIGNDFYIKKNYNNIPKNQLNIGASLSTNFVTLNKSQGDKSLSAINSSRGFQKTTQMDSIKKGQSINNIQNLFSTTKTSPAYTMNMFDQMTPIPKQNSLMSEISKIDLSKNQSESKQQIYKVSNELTSRKTQQSGGNNTFSISQTNEETKIKSLNKTQQQLNDRNQKNTTNPANQNNQFEYEQQYENIRMLMNSSPKVNNLKSQTSQTFSVTSNNFKQTNDYNYQDAPQIQQNQNTASYNYKDHLKQVFINRQKIFKADKPSKQLQTQNQTQTQQSLVEEDKDIKQSPYFQLNPQYHFPAK